MTKAAALAAVAPGLAAGATAPAEVTMGRSLYAAPHASVVRRSGATFSQVFFFFIWFSVCGSSCSASKSPNLIRSPGTAPSGHTRSSTFSCDASEAHRSMPWELTPAMLRALRFASTTTS